MLERISCYRNVCTVCAVTYSLWQWENIFTLVRTGIHNAKFHFSEILVLVKYNGTFFKGRLVVLRTKDVAQSFSTQNACWDDCQLVHQVQTQVW